MSPLEVAADVAVTYLLVDMALTAPALILMMWLPRKPRTMTIRTAKYLFAYLRFAMWLTFSRPIMMVQRTFMIVIGSHLIVEGEPVGGLVILYGLYLLWKDHDDDDKKKRRQKKWEQVKEVAGRLVVVPAPATGSV